LNYVKISNDSFNSDQGTYSITIIELKTLLLRGRKHAQDIMTIQLGIKQRQKRQYH